MYPSQVDPEREVEWDSNASTLNNDEDDAEEGKQWSSGLESPDARKAAKAERKAARNQVLFDVVTQEELAMVEQALHPQAENQASAISKGQGLADNRTIDENIAFNANTVKWGKLRQEIRAKKVAKNRSGKPKPNTPEQDNKILSPIFAQLGIGTNISKANRERKTLDSKLRAAILGDLLAFENDQVETMQRMAGYWRYASKRTYNTMVKNNELWDWATGEKLPEIREEAELDVIEEGMENAEAGNYCTEIAELIPENWDDPNFELSANVAAFSLTPLVDGSNVNNEVGGRHPELEEEVESTGDRISIFKPSSSPGCLTAETLSFNVSSPFSSNDTWEQLQAESGYPTEEAPEDLFNSSSITPRNPLTPTTPNPKAPHEKGFQGVKDTRVFGKAIRNASPPRKNSPRAPLLLQPIRNLMLPATTQNDSDNHNRRDPLNRFGALNHEVPAPCDEVTKKVDGSTNRPTAIRSVARFQIPAKPIVQTLVMHDETDDWTTKQRPVKRKKTGRVTTKGGSALREQPAGNKNKKFVGGKSFASAVKRGL